MDMQFFPAELRALPQWCVATLLPTDDGKEDKRPYNPRTERPASSTDRTTWGTFEEACACRDKWRSTTAPRAQIGFVFNIDDPFAVIDLDTYKAQNDDVRSLHAEIMRHADTYTELSQSGLGTHIIGLGLVIEGAHNEANSIELYSHARFMICTGNVAPGTQIMPLRSIQELLDYLYPLIKDGGKSDAVSWKNLGDGEESLISDADIVERMMNAANADKFLALCQGDLSHHGGDWSRADEALIQFFCYYTKDNLQVARLFMRSGLAQRDKAERPDYVPRTIAYARIKIDKDTPPPLDMREIADRARQVAAAGYQEPAQPAREEPSAVSPIDAPIPMPPPVKPFSYPPGLVGEIAQFALASAVRPVPEIALAAAIACVAGIVGRQYNCSSPGTGLNHYILLLAKTGTGKESIQSAIDRLFAEVQKTVPAAMTFLGPSRFASGQALNKRFQKQVCFVSILGEFGDTIRRLASKRANAADIALMSEIKDMYHKSGATQMLRSTVHSDSEKNTNDVHSPALTLLGETAPEPFFAALDESLIDSGLLPRFMVIEYKGERPARNDNPIVQPSPELIKKLADLTQSVLQMQQDRTVLNVQTSPGAKKALDDFDLWIDAQMRGQGEVVCQLWNRAHIKALRLSALIAVGCAPYAPMVEDAHAKWAIDIVRRDVAVFVERFARGDVGEGDAKMHVELSGVIRRYFTKCPKGYERFHQSGALPYRHLQSQTSNRPTFKSHKNGASGGLRATLESMLQAGELIQLEKRDASSRFGTTSAVYALGQEWDDAS